MKNIKYLFLVVAGVWASCSPEYDRIFDRSAAERMAATLEEYQKVLVSAPNGWTMDYYAEYPEYRIGGYVFIVSFDERGFVKMASETDLTREAGVVTANTVTSTYDLIADQGPVLTFNTYNRLLHQFTEPRGSSDTDGDAGDYEFVFMEVSADKIVMKGKKNENTITLRALPADTDWNKYIGDAMDMDLDNYYPVLRLSYKGTEVGVLNMTANRVLQLVDDGGEVSEWTNTIPTPEGFRLYESKTFFDVTVEEFIWDEVQKVYKSPDGSVVLTGSYPEGYLPFSTYLGTYTMTYLNRYDVAKSRTVTIVEAPSGNPNYVINNFSTVSHIYALYDRADGKLFTGCQSIGPYQNGVLQVWYWAGGTSISSNSTLTEGVLTTNESGKKVITLKVPMSFYGFIMIRAVGTSYYIVTDDDFFSSIVLTEQ